jgi:hypothetical protein
MATLTLPEPQLLDFAASCVDDPLRFVLAAFPWGEPGTPLAAHAGPDTWQADLLEALRAHVQTSSTSLRRAVASGHGVGKSAVASWVILWFLATRPHPQIVVTANTGAQLSTKTWRELAKWLQLSVFAATFTWTATKCYHRAHAATWFAAAVPWRADRPEAFAGTHEQHVLILMDESSAIDDLIWETTEGAMTTPGAMWLAFGNPTRNHGRFKQCFAGGRFAHRWQTTQVDSRDAKMADQAQIAQWITDYGDDSDFVRVRVKGLFPRVAVAQFIGEDLIQAARERLPVDDPLQPLVVGVDVARYGDDRSVILVRCGGTVRETRVYREVDTVRLAGYVCEVADQYRQQQPTLFVDAVGIGAGVVDQCRARGYQAQEVQAGGRAQDAAHYANKRAEMWDRVRQWLETRGTLDAAAPTTRELEAALTAPEYGYDAGGRLQIETKASMKARGLASSDVADALCHTFAEPVALKGLPAAPLPQSPQGPPWAREAFWRHR